MQKSLLLFCLILLLQGMIPVALLAQSHNTSSILERLKKLEERCQKLEDENRQLKHKIQQLQVKVNNNKAIWAKANQWNHTLVGNNSSKTVVSHRLSLPVPSYITVFGHGHGHSSNPNTALDVAIFIDGVVFKPLPPHTSLGWGTAITHTTTFTPIIAAIGTFLPAGNHTIELKMTARGNNAVSFSAPVMLILVTSIN